MIKSQSHNIIIVFFLDASSIECKAYQHHVIFDLWNNSKNFLPINRKIKNKNQILKY